MERKFVTFQQYNYTEKSYSIELSHSSHPVTHRSSSDGDVEKSGAGNLPRVFSVSPPAIVLVQRRGLRESKSKKWFTHLALGFQVLEYDYGTDINQIRNDYLVGAYYS